MERHRKANAFRDLNTPGDPRLLGAVERRTPGLATGSGSVNHYFGGTVLTPKKGKKSSDTLPPLWPTLVIEGTVDAPTYKVKLTTGYVNERIPGDGEALNPPNEIKDLKWGGDAPEGKSSDDPREFSITVGQQVSVVVYVDEDGALGGSAAPSGYVAALTIETEDTASSHYIPPIADETAGVPGVYHYKIAVLKAADADHPAPWIEKFLAGSHISHFVDLPKFKKEAGDFDIFKTYDAGTKTYKTKGLTEAIDDYALKSIKITDTGDELKFATDGGNLDIIVQVVTLEVVDPETGQISKNYIEDLNFYFRNGLYVGTTDPGGEAGDSLTLTHVIDWS